MFEDDFEIIEPNAFDVPLEHAYNVNGMKFIDNLIQIIESNKRTNFDARWVPANAIQAVKNEIRRNSTLNPQLTVADMLGTYSWEIQPDVYDGDRNVQINDTMIPFPIEYSLAASQLLMQYIRRNDVLGRKKHAICRLTGTEYDLYKHHISQINAWGKALLSKLIGHWNELSFHSGYNDMAMMKDIRETCRYLFENSASLQQGKMEMETIWWKWAEFYEPDRYTHQVHPYFGQLAYRLFGPRWLDLQGEPLRVSDD